MVLGMAPPPVAKPQPKPQLKVEANPIPEFMWCQRCDRVYVTIKVADCLNAKVNVTQDHVLEFNGTGHGMCGQRDYMLNIELADAVLASECVWFVSGPNVRVRLQKAKSGPHWAGLLKAKRKMPQLKVDWSSWLDEDEENECSSAPNGFDVPAMKTMMVGSDKDELYRDLDKYSSSATPDEGEETNSILIDEGMNSIEDLQIKFKALEYEKEETAKTKQARYELRKATREAQLFVVQHARDVKYGRLTRELTAREQELLAGADGLYERLKEEKQTEKLFWLSKWWHQRRPEKRKIDMAEPVALQAALDAMGEELDALKRGGADIKDPKTRRRVERRIFLRSRDAALGIFDQWRSDSTDAQRMIQDHEGKDFTARDMAARITRVELAKALSEPPPELSRSMQLKQFADPRPKQEAVGGNDGDDESESDSDSDDEDEEGEPMPKPARSDAHSKAKEEEEEEEEPELELEENDGPELELEENDDDVLELEENDGPELELEENDGDVLELEENDGPELELEENDGDGGLMLEENPAGGRVV